MARQPSKRVRQHGLLDLPIELQLSILQYLPFPWSQNLANTNRHFRSIIKPPTLSELKTFARDPSFHETIILLFVINSNFEIPPGPHKFIWQPNLACSHCVRLRPRSEFADYMPRWADDQFCVDCGLYPEKGRRGYKPGDELTIDYERHVWCTSCDTFTSEAGPSDSGLCAECAARDARVCLPMMKQGRVWRRSARQSHGKRKGEYSYEFEGRVGCLSQPRKGRDRLADFYVQDYYLENSGCWSFCEWADGERLVLQTYPVWCEVYGDDIEVPFWEPLSQKDHSKYWSSGWHLGR
jgi:hypothetical protein